VTTAVAVAPVQGRVESAPRIHKTAARFAWIRIINRHAQIFAVDNVKDRLLLERALHHHGRGVQVLPEGGVRDWDVERRCNVQILLIERKPFELVFLRKGGLGAQSQRVVEISSANGRRGHGRPALLLRNIDRHHYLEHILAEAVGIEESFHQLVVRLGCDASQLKIYVQICTKRLRDRVDFVQVKQVHPRVEDQGWCNRYSRPHLGQIVGVDGVPWFLRELLRLRSRLRRPPSCLKSRFDNEVG